MVADALSMNILFYHLYAPRSAQCLPHDPAPANACAASPS